MPSHATRFLGTTQLRVTPIGLGLAALGRPSYINEGRDEDLGLDRSVAAMEQRCHEVLDAALAEGLAYIDAARSYGLAETFLKSWLETRRIAPGRIGIGSKWGYAYVGDWRVDAAVHEVKNLSVDMLRRQIDESRALLGEWLGLYQIHSATIESGVLDDPSVLAALAQLSVDGLVIGLTVSGPQQGDTIRRALEVAIDGVNPFRCVQATWNLLEPSAGPALADAHARGWGVIVKEGLANGRLADRRDADPAVARLAGIARSCETSVDAVAIAAVLSNPWVDVVLSGAATPEQLRSNAGASSVHLTPEHHTVLAELAEPAPQYWTSRSARPWT